jgi:SAM-dependent methyltransferase
MSASDPQVGGIQVDASHYRPLEYLSPRRMASIGYQVQFMARHFPRAMVLEIGPGTGLATDLMRREGHAVTTLDIDPALHPTTAGSITRLPFADGAFDCVMCCQVLEHLPWEWSQVAIGEIFRVVRRGAVISVPSVRRMAAIVFTGPRRDGARTLPLFNFRRAPLRHTQEHYWEIAAGVKEREFRAALTRAGFTVAEELRPYTWMYHHFFVLTRRPTS